MLDASVVSMLTRMSNLEVARPWTIWTFRVLVSLAAVSAFVQPFLAGSYLSGHFEALDVHADNGELAAILTLLTTIAAVLMWKPGGGPSWPAAVCAGIFVAEGAEIALGYSGVLVIHIPLGTAILAAFVVLLLRVWRPAPAALQ